MKKDDKFSQTWEEFLSSDNNSERKMPKRKRKISHKAFIISVSSVVVISAGVLTTAMLVESSDKSNDATAISSNEDKKSTEETLEACLARVDSETPEPPIGETDYYQKSIARIDSQLKCHDNYATTDTSFEYSRLVSQREQAIDLSGPYKETYLSENTYTPSYNLPSSSNEKDSSGDKPVSNDSGSANTDPDYEIAKCLQQVGGWASLDNESDSYINYLDSQLACYDKYPNGSMSGKHKVAEAKAQAKERQYIYSTAMSCVNQTTIDYPLTGEYGSPAYQNSKIIQYMATEYCFKMASRSAKTTQEKNNYQSLLVSAEQEYVAMYQRCISEISNSYSPAYARTHCRSQYDTHIIGKYNAL